MYTLGRQTGYDNDTTNSYTSIVDYLPTASWGYSPRRSTHKDLLAPSVDWLTT